ncbi:hypothetical protein L596_009568 [Steinernema carpocapsae]|uniref:Uncharacterized protein n=1 Tax=Steinernema carpocapsae TaxID=34508 RepID=A0A4U5PG90_STECR|nr:hypothetical protein L596_009568 [Steinernema carpocapsae]
MPVHPWLNRFETHRGRSEFRVSDFLSLCRRPCISGNKDWIRQQIQRLEANKRGDQKEALPYAVAHFQDEPGLWIKSSFGFDPSFVGMLQVVLKHVEDVKFETIHVDSYIPSASSS